MEEENEYRCENCNKLFSKLNEYGLCDDCEEAIQKEKQSINETYETLMNL